MATTCARCGARKTFGDALVSDLGATVFICQSCKDREAEAGRLVEQQRVHALEQAAAKVIVTTTPRVDGTVVTKYLGIESVEYVIGTGIFSEVSSGFADMIGARSGAFEKKLQVAKQTAMAVLKYRAAEKGADAVIGVDLDYAEFSGNRVALIINGTMVKLAQPGVRPTAKQPDS